MAEITRARLEARDSVRPQRANVRADVGGRGCGAGAPDGGGETEGDWRETVPFPLPLPRDKKDNAPSGKLPRQGSETHT